MSPDQSALAVVQEVFRCFAGRDVPGLMAMLDEEIEWHEPDVDVPWRGVHRDHAGFVSWLHIIGREAGQFGRPTPRVHRHQRHGRGARS
jgi:ketosteroid isomerase-like protein